MKLLFDQNISHRIVALVEEQFHGSCSVKSEGLINATDLHIWQFAQKEGFTIVSKDADFNALHALHGHPPKIIWIRAGNIGTKAMADLLITNKNQLEEFSKHLDSGCLELLRMQTIK